MVSMLLIRYLGLILFCLMTFFESYSAKNPVFSETEHKSYTLKYIKEPLYSHNVNNLIIEEIARISLKRLNAINLIYSFDVHKAIYKSGLNNYTVEIKLDNFECKGDTKYKNFDLSTALFPRSTDFSTAVYWQDKTEIAEASFEELHSDTECFTASFDFTDLSGGGQSYSIKVDNFNFRSTENNLVAFRENLARIDEFYASSELIKKMTGNVEQIFTHKNYLSDSHIILLHFYRNIVSRINHEDFGSGLVLPADIGKEYNNRLSNLNNKFYSMSLHIPDIYQRMGDVNYLVSSHTADLFTEQINSIFNLSKSSRFEYSNYIYQFGNVNYTNSTFSTYVNDLEDYLPERKSIILYQGKNNILGSLLDQTKEKLTESNFNEASDLINGAIQFNKIYNHSGPSIKMMNLKARADYGIYDSYLKITDRATQTGSLELAENYLSKAYDFQKNNKETIISDAEIISEYENLISLYIKKALNLTDNKKFEEALVCYDKTEKLSRLILRFNFDYTIEHGILTAKNGYHQELLDQANIGLLNFNFNTAQFYLQEAIKYRTDNRIEIPEDPAEKFIKTEIARNKYTEYYIKGVELCKAEKLFNAFDYLQNAGQLQEEYDFTPLPDFKEYMRKASKHMILNKIEKGLALIIEDSLDQAEHVYLEVKEICDRQDLQEYEEVSGQIKNFEAQLSDKLCQLDQIKIENLIREFSLDIKQQNYIQGVEILQKALNIIDSNQLCSFIERESYIHEKINLFTPLSQLQQNELRIRNDLENNNFEKVSGNLDNYLFLYKNQTSQSAVHNKNPLNTLVNDEILRDKLIDCISYNKFMEEYNVCLQILTIFQRNDFNSKNFRDIQKELGILMGKSDKLSGKENNFDQQLYIYTGNSDWFSVFNKNYLQSCR